MQIFLSNSLGMEIYMKSMQWHFPEIVSKYLMYFFRDRQKHFIEALLFPD